MNWLVRPFALCIAILCLSVGVPAQSKRKVIIDQDAAGPGGTDMLAILVLVNSPDTDVLGITVLTGEAWRDEEVLHTLRLMEIIGRPDSPVVPGAEFPLVNSKEYMARWEATHGKVVYQGAWNSGLGPDRKPHGPKEIPPMPEGAPTIKAAKEDAAHFMVRTVRQYPHDVTVYAAGPMTDLALAVALDPEFPSLTKELIVMGGSLNPQTDDPEFTLSPTREFNFWMDPEATHAVLHAKWPRMVLTTVDISVKTHMEKALIEEVRKSPEPAAQYARNMPTPDICGTNWPPSRGSTPPSSRSGGSSTWTLTWTTAPATATRSPGPPASNPAWGKSWWRFRTTWTSRNSIRSTWTCFRVPRQTRKRPSNRAVSAVSRSA